MYLFFDTETTGLPISWRAPINDLENWPRIVQIAWILTDKLGSEIESRNYIVRPDGFEIPPGAVRIHRITTERALIEGIPAQDAMAEFAKAIDKSKVIVAHNIDYDRPIAAAELLRLKMSNNLYELPAICTQRKSTNYCKLPGNYGYKWPKLEELYSILFNEKFIDAHDAYVDVRACMKCFFELKNRGAISVPDVIPI